MALSQETIKNIQNELASSVPPTLNPEQARRAALTEFEGEDKTGANPVQQETVGRAPGVENLIRQLEAVKAIAESIAAMPQDVAETALRLVLTSMERKTSAKAETSVAPRAKPSKPKTSPAPAMAVQLSQRGKPLAMTPTAIYQRQLRERRKAEKAAKAKK